MKEHLPTLAIKELGPTRDRLRDAALVLSSLQRGFLPEHPRQWQYGLEVHMRGLLTQEFNVQGEATRASIDLVRRKVRLGAAAWRLDEYDGPELFKNVRVWLESKDSAVQLEEPKFRRPAAPFDKEQAAAYAEALWWLDKQFRVLKAGIAEGVTSPILLYPHHFDLSLVWFPHDNERQLGIGWSGGDKTISEPYLYLTAYPEPAGFTKLELPPEAHWQSEDFSGAVLPYAALAASAQPAELFERFARGAFTAARPLLG